MSPLDLQFKLDDLLEEPRPFRGEIPVEALDEVLRGMIGDLGYRAQGPASVRGSAYRSKRDVFIEAEVSVSVGFDCVRCLDPLGLTLTRTVRHLLVPGKRETAPESEVTVEFSPADDADEDLDCYEGDAIDVIALLREDILLELPMNPTCIEAQGAACPRYDEVLSTQDAGPETGVDPRWAPLLELKKKLS
jgi:uncharacterized metal-binding protein YceD (DUF177 family)